MRIGVLAVQGGVEPHVRALQRLGHDVVRIRTCADLRGIEGLVLPGGESTTQRKLLGRLGLIEPLDAAVQSGVPVLATCAGVILAATFGWLSVDVDRNAWGRQIHSFEAIDDAGELDLVFIRAPRFNDLIPEIEVLATLGGEPVWVRENNVFAATFHPELGSDPRPFQRAFGGTSTGRT